MAVMWPREIPAEIVSNILRSAECRVYNRLRDVLEDSFVVFYSRPWLGLTPFGEEKDGECDFLIAHPNLGILAIEVKGGEVSYDPKLDKWKSRDRWNVRHKIKNPVGQARTSKHHLLKKLKDSGKWKSRRIRARHGVILPDSECPGEDLGPDSPRSIFCCLDEFETDLRQWVMNRYGEIDGLSQKEKPLGEDGIRALEAVLAHPFQLHVPLGNILASDDAQIETLTYQQFHTLTFIQDIHRAAISGGAGTGKTVLAMEEAVRRAGSGEKILFLCFNHPLAEYIHHRLESWKNIRVVTFHELCYQMANKAGIQLPGGISEKKLSARKYSDILGKALQILHNHRFNVIIVDEGQDFSPEWLSTLDKALHPDGFLRIFFDSNQSVYGTVPVLPLEINQPPFRLSLNMRNTRRIHNVVQKYYNGSAIEPIGPEGVEVEWIHASSASEIQSIINQRVHHLLTEERIRPSDIAVLVTSAQKIAEFAPDARLDGVECRNAEAIDLDFLILDTIRRFKGLERRVVIIAATPDMTGDRELIYVATSRARAYLVIVGNVPALQNLY